jgi:hypothetical protein
MLNESTSLSELYLPSCGRVFPYVDTKQPIVGTRGFQASVFLTSRKYANTHTGKILKVTT